jgi:hypothetical protein
MPASQQRMQHDARRSFPQILVLVLHRENITAVGTTPTPPRGAGVAENMLAHHENVVLPK